MKVIINCSKAIAKAIAEHFEDPDRLEEEFLGDRITKHTDNFEDLKTKVTYEHDSIIININY
jgi:hypothetical protein